MSKTIMERTIDRYFAALSALDMEGWLEMFADDAEHQDPIIAPRRQGRTELEEYFAQTAGLFASLSLHADKVWRAENHVAVTWSGEGEGTNGAKVKLSGVDIFVFNTQGRIQSLEGYWDPTEVMGMLLAQSA